MRTAQVARISTTTTETRVFLAVKGLDRGDVTVSMVENVNDGPTKETEHHTFRSFVESKLFQLAHYPQQGWGGVMYCFLIMRRHGVRPQACF
jgi:hypothetical protein